MNLATFLTQSFQFSRDTFVKLAEDMRDAPRTFPTPRGGNHPQWLVGHVTLAESKLIQEFALGEDCPYSEWLATMGPGTEPVADAKAYPAYDTLLASFKTMRERTLRALSTMKDADFDRPSHAPEQFKEIFPTVGPCFLHALLHCNIHTGQLADARRAAGRKPMLFTPPNPELAEAR